MLRADYRTLPDPLRDSARMVERTRDERLARLRRGESFPLLSLSDRQAWIEEYHPDHAAGGVRPLRFGPSQDTHVPVELADLLEAWPLPEVMALKERPPLQVDLTTDVLVIGGGGAGTAAAIAAARDGADVILATKLRHGDSNTIMAEGGIQVADQECDSPLVHFLDTMGGGHFTNAPELVEALVSEGPAVLRWIEELGMLFDKYPTGRMKVRHGGGTSRKRLHSCGDVTGLELMRVIRDHAESLNNIRVLPFAPAVELLTDDNTGRAVGAVLLRLTGERKAMVVSAKAVVLATGGLGRLHLQGYPTSNHHGATADGLAIGYRAGLPLRDLRHSQYHPTGIAFPEQKAGLLVTEKFRGLGAQLLNRHGDEFINSLEPRDVTTAAILRECREFGNGAVSPTGRVGVWLDIPLIDLLHGRGAIEREFPGRLHEFAEVGVDIRTQPVLVYPTLHYQNGGLTMGVDGGTDMPGLFAAGEVTGGVHGNNRLMGNALLEILVFGLRAGHGGAAFARQTKSTATPGFSHLDPYLEALREAWVSEERTSPLLLPVYGPGRLKTALPPDVGKLIP